MISFPGPVPVEALQFIQNKGLKASFSWLDIWREEHAHNFTVAKAMQVDVLQSINDEVLKAIENGTTLAQFQKDLTPTLQKLGWWGRLELADPTTGEIIDAQLGSPRRLKTIYRANLRSARSAGQWHRAQRTKQALPYFKYSLGPSKVHRPEHEKWDQTILPVDHPFWDTHFTPNGWECKCRIRQISQVEMQRKGLQISADPKVKLVEFVNQRSGEVVKVPEGIDPGWDTNPGKHRQQTLQTALNGKLKTADPSVATTIKKDLEDYRARNAA